MRLGRHLHWPVKLPSKPGLLAETAWTALQDHLVSLGHLALKVLLVLLVLLVGMALLVSGACEDLLEYLGWTG